MSKRRWIPPLELEPQPQEAAPKEKPEFPAPRILAEEGESAFVDYLRKGEVIDRGEISSLEREVEGLKQQALRQRHLVFRWFLGAIGALVVGLILVDTAAFLKEMFARSFFLGFLFTSFLAIVSVTLVLLVREQMRDIWRMHDLSSFQAEARRLTKGEEGGSAAALVARIVPIYQERAELKPKLQAFQSMANEAHRNAEVLNLFSRHVLHPFDERAYGVIVKYASQTALITAISPLALLDALFSLWRNVRMVREIAMLYGGRPGFAGSFTLLRGVFGNLALAGVSDIVADTGAEAFGGTFLASLSARAGQGVVMGVYTARIGLISMRLCRPIPFHGEERAYFARIRRQVVKVVHEAMASKGGGNRPEEGQARPER
jgi:putative membrane protein